MQSGLSIPAGQQVTVPVGGAPGRYVIIYAGQGTMALDNVQVYAAGEMQALRRPTPRLAARICCADAAVDPFRALGYAGWGNPPVAGGSASNESRLA